MYNDARADRWVVMCLKTAGRKQRTISVFRLWFTFVDLYPRVTRFLFASWTSLWHVLGSTASWEEVIGRTWTPSWYRAQWSDAAGWSCLPRLSKSFNTACFFCILSYHNGATHTSINCIFALWRPSRMVEKLQKQMATVLSTPWIRRWKLLKSQASSILMQHHLRGTLNITKPPNPKWCFLQHSWFSVGEPPYWFRFLFWL